MNQSNNRAAGFSLVEVSLAMMIITVGVITLFGLFPASLKQGEEAYKNTHTAQFAEYVLNGLRGSFDEAPDYAQWEDDNYCRFFLQDITRYEPTLKAEFSDPWGGLPAVVEFPRGSGTYVRYILEMTPPGGDIMNWQVALWAWSGKYGPSKVEDHKLRSQWFATEIFYGGMP